jgi:hypothetical protein
LPDHSYKTRKSLAQVVDVGHVALVGHGEIVVLISSVEHVEDEEPRGLDHAWFARSSSDEVTQRTEIVRGASREQGALGPLIGEQLRVLETSKRRYDSSSRRSLRMLQQGITEGAGGFNGGGARGELGAGVGCASDVRVGGKTPRGLGVIPPARG